MRGTLIAFAGPIGAGKSTAARWLEGNRGFMRTRFAGPLKAMMAALGLNEREIDGDLKEAPCALLGGKTPRHAMQTLGTEWGRELIDQELWTRAWGWKVSPILIGGGNVVVDDCRFENEARVVRALGGKVIRVWQPTDWAISHHWSHVSERFAFEVDEAIVNDLSPTFFDALRARFPVPELSRA